jgi:hypothetical protein
MPDEAALPYALAGLATTASLMDVLLKRGVIDEAFIAEVTKEAIAYAQALCTEWSPDVERETQRILQLINQPKTTAVTASDQSPIESR